MSGSDADIVFVTRKWAPATGGMETYSLRLTQALAEHHAVDVVALPGRADAMPPRAFALLMFPFKLAAYLLRRKKLPRVLHLGDMALWPLALLTLGRAQIILSAHGTDVAYHRRGGVRGTLYGLYARLGGRLLGKARVIANSRATAQFAAAIGWRQVEVVPLAADFAPPPGLPPVSGRTILFAGRLVRRKGCAWFIRQVLPLLPPDITLKVAGTVWDSDEQAALADPRVSFLGSVAPADLALLYAEALCVVVPNIDARNGEYEGFGLVAPEAAAAGGVVLAADHGGLADAVIDGETGFLLPMGDAPRWAEKIAAIADWDNGRRADFTAAAMARARAHYSWQRVARETAAHYRAA